MMMLTDDGGGGGALQVCAGGGGSSEVTGQTVVLTGTVTVVRTVLCAGQEVTVGWQLMIVLVVVLYTVLVVYF